MKYSCDSSRRACKALCEPGSIWESSYKRYDMKYTNTSDIPGSHARQVVKPKDGPYSPLAHGEQGWEYDGANVPGEQTIDVSVTQEPIGAYLHKNSSHQE